jgi:hypothetical protein
MGRCVTVSTKESFARIRTISNNLTRLTAPLTPFHLLPQPYPKLKMKRGGTTSLGFAPLSRVPPKITPNFGCIAVFLFLPHTQNVGSYNSPEPSTSLSLACEAQEE